LSQVALQELRMAVVELYEKLKAAGEIASAEEIPSLWEFMRRYGPAGQTPDSS
jgi:hypothetical protein